MVSSLEVITTAEERSETRPRPAAPLRIEVIRNESGFAALRGDWNELLRSSRADSLFLTWEWLHTWWMHLRGHRQLFLVTVRSDSQLIAVAPLTMRRSWRGPFAFRTLEFCGIGNVGSDYLDFIIHSRYENAAAEALIRFFNDEGLTLRLPSVREDSIVASLVAPSLVSRRWQLRSAATEGCPFIDLSAESWDSYLANLGPSHFRQRLRQLEKSYAVRWERAESRRDCRHALQHLVELHLRRWKNRGGSNAFHDRDLLAFHNEFTVIAGEQGWLRLRLIRIEDQPAGAFYGFSYGRKFYFYQSGFNEAFRPHSIGLVMIGLTIAEAIEEHALEYDLLHGEEPYKFRWAQQVRPLRRIELYPPNVAGVIQRHGVLMFDATKRVAKRVLKRAH